LKFDTGLMAVKHSYSAPDLTDNYITVSGLTGNSIGQGLEFTIENISTANKNIPPLPIGAGSYKIPTEWTPI
jgi:hypothetical protein